jgi:(E)-4-hydroxy-3-methylbut-2-enyl-diphosphate synthase
MKKEIFVGNVGIGGPNPVSIQSMTSTNTNNIKATLDQIRVLKDEGCEIIRVAVPDQESIKSLATITKESPLPVVADIQFDAYLALKSIEAGVHCLRINPGNIGSRQKIKDIIREAKVRGIPIRIGVNWGSIEKKYWRVNRPKAEIMVESVLDKVRFFEDNGFFNIKLSLKSSSVSETVSAYRLIDKACAYPLHLGITEAGTLFSGTIKSAIGIGGLLLDGIGNTIRVSLTENPVEEIKVAKEILRVVGLRNQGIELVSCPTCSRTTVDLIGIVKEVEKRLKTIKPKGKIVVAIMGCEVNGPGEAKDADIGLAFSKNHGYIFRKGKLIEKVKPKNSIERLEELIQK